MIPRRIITTARNLTTAADRAALRSYRRLNPPPSPLGGGDGGGGGDGNVGETLSQKIMSLVKPRDSAVVIIRKWKNEGNSVRKNDLSRIVRELCRLNRFKHAFEICEWMKAQEDIKLLAGDYALQLDLIAKLRGQDSAEQFFADIPAKMRSGPTYSSLLHTFVQHRDYDKAETLMKRMSKCGLLNYPLPYNHMMTMYLENGKVEKIPGLINELKKKTTLDVVSYNLWLTMCQSQNDLETAENVFLEMKTGKLEPDWITYSILTSLYTKNEQNDKARFTLTEMEKRVSQEHRSSYSSLISLHTNLGNKSGVERIWEQMKSVYHKLNDAEFRCMIDSLLKLGDQKNAEKLYDEWESISPTCDVRVANLLLRDYVSKDQVEKAYTFLHRVVEKGVKPNYRTWELLTRGFLKSKQVDQILDCFEKALCSVKKREPNLGLVREIYQHLEEHRDIQAAEKLLSLLRKADFVTTEIYNLHLRVYVKAAKMPPIIEERMVKDNVLPDSETKELIRVTSKMCINDVTLTL